MFKGIFSDSNSIFFSYESEDINKKLISKISVDSKFTCTSFARFCVFHWSVDCCVELIIVYDNLCANCFHLLLKWFQLNSFGVMCFLGDSCKKMQKILFKKKKKKKKNPLSEHPLYEIIEYAFKTTKANLLKVSVSRLNGVYNSIIFTNSTK